MKALAAFLSRFQSFRDALISAGWLPPDDEVVVQSGPGPWRPPQ